MKYIFKVLCLKICSPANEMFYVAMNLGGRANLEEIGHQSVSLEVVLDSGHFLSLFLVVHCDKKKKKLSLHVLTSVN